MMRMNQMRLAVAFLGLCCASRYVGAVLADSDSRQLQQQQQQRQQRQLLRAGTDFDSDTDDVTMSGVPKAAPLTAPTARRMQQPFIRPAWLAYLNRPCTFTPDIFTASVFVEAAGTPENFELEEVMNLEGLIETTYNTLQDGLCDTEERMMWNVTLFPEDFQALAEDETTNSGSGSESFTSAIITTPGGRRRLQEPVRNRGTRRRFVFRFFVVGTCRACAQDTRLFQDVVEVRRRAQEIHERVLQGFGMNVFSGGSSGKFSSHYTPASTGSDTSTSFARLSTSLSSGTASGNSGLATPGSIGLSTPGTTNPPPPTSSPSESQSPSSQPTPVTASSPTSQPSASPAPSAPPTDSSTGSPSAADIFDTQSCQCLLPEETAQFRPPTREEFRTALNSRLGEGIETGEIINIDEVTGIAQVDEVDCAEALDRFEAETIVNVNGNPDNVTVEDLERIGWSFIDSYNFLASRTCDPFFRTAFNATVTLEIDDEDVGDLTELDESALTLDQLEEILANTGGSLRSRYLQADSGTTTTRTRRQRRYRFIVRVTGRCRGCVSETDESVLFNDVFDPAKLFESGARRGRGLLRSAAGSEGEVDPYQYGNKLLESYDLSPSGDIAKRNLGFLVSDGSCFCAPNTTEAPPTVDEFAFVFDEALLELQEEGAIPNGTVGELGDIVQTNNFIPSTVPSSMPSDVPSGAPSPAPSSAPSATPTATPTDEPSASPSANPSPQPSSTPTMVPSLSPSENPSLAPSQSPSSSPSATPSQRPTVVPTEAPSGLIPTESPRPSPSPSVIPTDRPTNTER